MRQQCRDRIVELVTGLTTSGANVLTNVVYDIERLTLPSIGVSEHEERREPVSMPSPRLMDCKSDFNVTLYGEDNDDLEALLDTMAKEVEVALAMPVAGPWKVLTQLMTGIEASPTNKIQGRRILRYRAEYLIRENAPDTAL